MTTAGEQRRLASGGLLSWIGLAVGFLVLFAVSWLWLADRPRPELIEQLIRIQLPALELQFLLLVGLGAFEARALFRNTGAGPHLWPAAALLVAIALLLVVFVPPKTNRIYYDEQIYQGIAQNLSDMRRAQMCNEGYVEYEILQCQRGEYNKQPYGWPYLISILDRLLGTREANGFWLARFAHALTVGVLFLLGGVLLRQPTAGLLAGGLFTFLPDQLQWSNTVASEPAASLFAATAVLAAAHHAREDRWRSGLWLAAAAAFAIQLRTESLLILPIVGLVFLLQRPRLLLRARIWWCALFGAALALSLAGHLFAVRTENWGASGPRMALEYVHSNLSVNGPYYLTNARFPLLVTALAALGLGFLLTFRTPTPKLSSVGARRGGLLVIWFLVFWWTYLMFYAGSYSYGADVRYALLTFAPLTLLAGAGADAVLRSPGPAGRAGKLVLVGLGVITLLWALPRTRSIGEEAWAAREDVLIARLWARQLPPHSLVLTHNPSMFHVWGRNAAQASLATTDSGVVREVLAPRFPGEVYFHWNFWCNVNDPVQQAFCVDLLALYEHQLVFEERRRDYRYALYRLDLPTP